MKKELKIGASVRYQKWDGRSSKAVILGIEVCKHGEKEGQSVPQAQLDTHLNIVLTLDNGCWCYGEQIKQITNPKNNNHNE